MLPKALVALLPAQLQALCSATDCASGETLFRTGGRPRSMFYVCSGEVVLQRHSANGQLICLQRCTAGFVGEASLTADRYHCDAQATRQSHLIQIPINTLQQVLREDADFAQRWIAMLSREVRQLRLLGERLSLPRVQDRVLHLIETEGGPEGYRLSCSVKDLATQLAVTHEALYRTLTRLVASGRISRQGDWLGLPERNHTA